MATSSAPPILSRVPDHIFALQGLNHLAREIILSRENRRLLITLKSGEPALTVGMHTWDPQKKTLATVGKKNCNITISGWRSNISRLHCTFSFHPESGEILFQDVSAANSTSVTSQDIREFPIDPHRERRQVVLHPEFNNIIGIGGEHSDLFVFILVWNDKVDPKEVKDQLSRSSDVAKVGHSTILEPAEIEEVRFRFRVRQNYLRSKFPLRVFQTSKIPLGKGGYGVVFPAIDVDLGHRLAVKRIRERGPNNDNTLEHVMENFHREVHVAASLNHKHVLDFYGHKEYEEAIAGFVGEIYTPAQDGSVEDLLRFGELSLEDTNLLLKHSLIGLDYIHWRGYIHNDIKPWNILYTRQKNGELLFKLADFGLCCKGTSSMRASIGTPRFMAPEALGIPGNREVTQKVDIWSLYVTMVYVMRPDYRHQWVNRLVQRGDPANVEMDPEDIVAEIGEWADEPNLKHLKQMVEWKPADRPTAGKLLWELFKVKGLKPITRKQAVSRKVAPPSPTSFDVRPSEEGSNIAISQNASQQSDIVEEPSGSLGSITALTENAIRQVVSIEELSGSLYNGRTDTTIVSSSPCSPADTKGKKRVFYDRGSTHGDLTASSMAGPSKRR